MIHATKNARNIAQKAAPIPMPAAAPVLSFDALPPAAGVELWAADDCVEDDWGRLYVAVEVVEADGEADSVEVAEDFEGSGASEVCGISEDVAVVEVVDVVDVGGGR